MANKTISKISFSEAITRLIENAKVGTFISNLNGSDYVLDDHSPSYWWKISKKRGATMHDLVGKPMTSAQMTRKLLGALGTGEEIALSTRSGVMYLEGWGDTPSIYNDRTRAETYYKW